MSPEDKGAGLLRALLADGRADLEALAPLHDRLAEALGVGAEQGPAHAGAAVITVVLHDYYGAVEGFLTRVARCLDGSVPSGPEWHRDLLLRMARPLAGVRPAVVSADSLALLRQLLGFRHFFRYAYWVQPVRVGGFLANLLPYPARAAKSLAEPQSSQRKVLSWLSPLRLGGSARKFFSCGELCQGLAARSPG